MRSTAVVTAIAAVAALLLPGVAAATEPEATEPKAAVPTLEWADCGDGFQCATAAVPLDHDEPDGPTIDLALIKRPASDPAARVGSLFTNPGGPGGSDIAFVRGLAPLLLDPQILAQFDLVGVDPRGVGASSPLRCFDSTEEQLGFFGSLNPGPVTDEGQEATAAASAELGERCVERNPEIAEHLSTANVARDLHLIMQAVGDDQLNFYGISYGTYVGATFANLFPDDVRALVLDGVVDPDAYAGNDDGDDVPAWIRAGSNVGSSETLGEFFRLCAEAGAPDCAFAEGGDPEAKFAELADRLRAEPVTIVDPALPGGQLVLTYELLVVLTVQMLYMDVGWPGLALVLEGLHGSGDPAATAELMRAAQTMPAPVPDYSNQPEALRAVICADTTNPDDPDRWPELARAADEETPYVGSYWAYLSQPCATWPVSDDDRYTGPFDAETANPVLVVGSRFDPATPYRNSEELADDLPGAGLLTLEGWGHTSLGQTECAATIGKYLVSGELPGEELTCFPNRQPFDPLPDAPGIPPEQAARAAAVLPVLPAESLSADQ